MASQVAVFAETIAGMKKAVKRKAYDSDSDSSIEQLTNRGNKLRKKARYVRDGQLGLPSGPQVYKRRIEHAGFQRNIISRNPPLVDEDGYEVDSEDDDERADAAIAAAAEFDPYSNVKIEHLLAPLTAASDLPDHPTLSKPFTSKTLTELTRQAGDMVQKERASLWTIKHLLTRLSGDHTWIPCEIVETERDIDRFGDDQGGRFEKSIVKDDGDRLSASTSISDEAVQQAGLLLGEAERPVDTALGAEKVTAETATAGVDALPISSILLPDVEAAVGERNDEQVEDGDDSLKALNEVTDAPIQADIDGSMAVEDAATMSGSHVPDERKENQEPGEMEITNADDGAEEEDNHAPRRMRTRAQAQAASDNTATSRSGSVTPDSNTEPFIHPYFLAPASSRPDRDLGLPKHEAEETRRLLQLYIQKQEEVCRGAQRVYDGLLKADRYRHMVMKWAKAEGHVGHNRDMSDGEDWYDKEEWGLEEDLKKGQDEEEEDAATTAKKTRTRRQ